MGLTAGACLFIGVAPGPLYSILPYPVDYNAYTTSHVVTQLQLLLFAALAFGVMMRTGIYPPEVRSVNLDFDWVYRRALPLAVAQIRTYGGRLWQGATDLGQSAVGRVLAGSRRAYGPGSPLGEPWLIGRTALWAAMVLVAFMLLEFWGISLRR
jgi:multicomponent Na+:H+ antiporter subunit D